ncbi:hypothetical protein H6G17_01300 [Chroococcidiopsis sp. FACHB-1243]|uniref:hypothetical protein n=1 Tax=Chroococcidiopsis sp. [FACHB-1243] TaxID=2692781 RepID=UPI00177C8B55|nr:hypothetical protein [Chroococcidiopsis sp. [FACHB-1243]]MBD2304158.1 hypothetical protein [Chroococcidiopsis sp. [FACHB-1243]]
MNESFHTEFEVVRLKDLPAEDGDLTFESEHENNLGLGMYILIKKEFKQQALIDNLQEVLKKDEVKLQYRKLSIVEKIFKISIT